MYTPDPAGLIGEYLFEAPTGPGGTVVGNTANPGTLDGTVIHNAANYPLRPVADVPAGFPTSTSLDFNVLRTLLGEGVDPNSPGDQRANAQYVEVAAFPDLQRLTVEAWVKVDYAKTPVAFQVPSSGTYPDGMTGFGACPQPVCMSFSWYLFLSTLQTDRNLILTIIGDNVTQGLPKSADVPAGSGGSGGVVSQGIVAGGNEWTHITATVGPYSPDPTNNIMRVYIDGVESYQEMVTDFDGDVHNIPRVTDQSIDPSSSSLLRLGIFRDVLANLDYQHSGRLCGVRIYNRALTREQICADIAADTATPEVVSYPPSIAFGEVAEGLVTTRPITVEVRGCTDTTLSASFVGAPGPFSMPLGGSVAISGADRYDGVSEGTIWLAYTTGAVGPVSNATVQIDVADAGFSEQIAISAQTRARPTASTVLVLDRSGSMGGNVGVPGVSKVDSLREAARTFVNLMQDGDKVAIVRYNQDAPAPFFDLTNVGIEDIGAGRNDAITYINGPELTPSGYTSIGDGVFEGGNLLSGSTDAVQAIVVMTDGIENRDRMLADPDVQASLTDQTFAVGLGSPSTISTGALNAIVSGTNGYLVVTGDIDTNNRFKLIKYYTQILSDIDNMNIVVDPQGVVTSSTLQKIAYSLNETDIDVDVILLSPAAPRLYFAMEAPDGTIIDRDNADDFPNVRYILKDDIGFFRIRMPVFLDGPEKHVGGWKAHIGLAKKGGGRPDAGDGDDVGTSVSIPYAFMVRTRSNFDFRFHLTQPALGIGQPFHLNVSLREYGIPVTSRFNVAAQITDPTGAIESVPLAPSADGAYGLTLDQNVVPGVYTVCVKARGFTMKGSLVEREKTLTGIIQKEKLGAETPDRAEIGNKLTWMNRCCMFIAALLVILILIQLFWR